MTQLVSGVLIIKTEAPGTCQLCHAKAETRPYGPNGENICFPCAMKPEHRASTHAAFKKIIDHSNAIFFDPALPSSKTNGN